MKKAVFIFFLIFLIGCGGAIIVQNIFGNYYLFAPDIPEQLALSYHEAKDKGTYVYIIEPTVFAVGCNGKYIIAKQHPYVSDTLNKKITNYYILRLNDSMNWQTTNGMIGPLNERDFISKKKELGIEKLSFTIVHKELE